MPDVLVRGISDEAKQALASQARSNGRSIQAELRFLIEGLITQEYNAAGLPAIPEKNIYARALTTDVGKDERAKKRQAAYERIVGNNGWLDFQGGKVSVLSGSFPNPVDVLAECRAEQDASSERIISSLTFGGERA